MLLSHPIEKDLAPTILIVITVMISAAASLAASIVVTIAALITLAVPTAAGTLDWESPTCSAWCGAPAAEANVRVDITNEWATVCIANAASHPVSVSDSGSGLQGIRQRAEPLGGSFHAGPAPSGWLVQAKVHTNGADLSS